MISNAFLLSFPAGAVPLGPFSFRFVVSVHPEYRPPEVVNPPSRPSGPFKLDENVIAEIECNWVKAEQHRKLDLPKIDVSFIYDSITVIPVRGVAYPEDKFQQLLARTLHRPISAHSRDYAMSPPSHLRSPAYGGGGSNKPKPTAKYVCVHFVARLSVTRAIFSALWQLATVDDVCVFFLIALFFFSLADALPKLDPNLLRIIRGIGSADVYTAHAAINELSDILESQEKQAVLRDYEEIYIQSILQQFKVRVTGRSVTAWTEPTNVEFFFSTCNRSRLRSRSPCISRCYTASTRSLRPKRSARTSR